MHLPEQRREEPNQRKTTPKHEQGRRLRVPN